MSTARISKLAYSSSTIRTISSIEEATIDLVAGSAWLAEMLHVATGLAVGVLNSLPIAGLLLAAAGIVKALDESYHAPLQENDNDEPIYSAVNVETHAESFVRTISSGMLSFYAYENLGQTMTLGSSAFGSMCDGMAIRAAGEFLIDAYEFLKAMHQLKVATDALGGKRNREINPEIIANYVEAKRRLTFSFFNLLGWGLLAIAHLPMMTIYATPLMAFGFTALATAGLYAGYTAYQRYSNALTEKAKPSTVWGDNSPSPILHQASKTSFPRLNAFYSLFWNPAYGAVGDEVPPKADAEALLMKKPTILKNQLQ